MTVPNAFKAVLASSVFLGLLELFGFLVFLGLQTSCPGLAGMPLRVVAVHTAASAAMRLGHNPIGLIADASIMSKSHMAMCFMAHSGLLIM